MAASTIVFDSINASLHAAPSSPVFANICAYPLENGSYMLQSTFYEVVSTIIMIDADNKKFTLCLISINRSLSESQVESVPQQLPILLLTPTPSPKEPVVNTPSQLQLAKVKSVPMSSMSHHHRTVPQMPISL